MATKLTRTAAIKLAQANPETLAITSARKVGWWAIDATDAEGYTWTLNHGFKTEGDIYRTLERIRTKMEIDTRHWHCLNARRAERFATPLAA